MSGDDHAIGGTAGRFDNLQGRQSSRLRRRQLGVRPQHVLHLSRQPAHECASCVVYRRRLRGRPASADRPAVLDGELDSRLSRFGPGDPTRPVRFEVHERAHARYEPNALRRLVGLGHGAEDRARTRDQIGHQLLPLPRHLDRKQAGLHERVGRDHALRRSRRHNDRHLPGDDEHDRRIRSELPSDRKCALRQGDWPEGYYGVFTANFHTDNAASPESDATVTSAQAHGIPIRLRQADVHVGGRPGHVVVRRL